MNFLLPRRALAGLWCLFFSSVAFAAPPPPGLGLFNGESLEGWYSEGCQTAVKDGLLVIQPGPGRLRAQTHLEDFVLEGDWRTGSKRKGNLYYRIDKLVTNGEPSDTGSVTPLTGDLAADVAKPGEWNHFKLTVQGNHAELSVNNAPAWKKDNLPAQEGAIAFAAPTDGDPLELRNLTVIETGFTALPASKKSGIWEVNAKTGHSRTSKNKSGGKWEFENGVIVGTQDIPGNGGILITDKQYGEFEVALQMNNDYGPDSGLFLRSTDKGVCYQCRVDYHADGSLAGVYGEGMGGDPNERCFKFLETPEKIEKLEAPFGLPVAVKDWPKFWRHDEWNEIRARITGNPPVMKTWINGVQFLDFHDTKKRLGDTGGIALQIHGGIRGKDGAVRYRNVRVKELKSNEQAAGSR